MQQEKDKRSEQIRYGLLHRRKSGFQNVGSWNQLRLCKQQSGIQPFHKSTDEESEVQKGTMRHNLDTISTL